MDMNQILPQSSASPKPQPAVQETVPVGKSSAAPSGTRKSFSSVLRTVHREDGQALRKGSDVPSRSAAPAGDDMREMRRSECEPSPGSTETQHSGCELSDGRTTDTGCSIGAGAERPEDDPEGQPDLQADTITPRLILALLQTPADGQATAAPVLPGSEGAEGFDQPDQLSLLPTDSTQPVMLPAPRSGASALADASEAMKPSKPISAIKDQPLAALEEATTPVIHTDPASSLTAAVLSSGHIKQEPDSEEGASGTSTSEANDAPTRISAVPEGTRSDATLVPADRLAEPPRAATHSDQLAGPARPTGDVEFRPLRDPRAIAPRPEPGQEASAEENPAEQPLSEPDGFTVFAPPDSQSDRPSTDREPGRQPADDTALRPGAPVLAESHQNGSGPQPALIAGQSGQPAQGVPDPHSATGMAAIPSVAAGSEAGENAFPALSKSVVFEVAQSDLGRVQVRVAMTNDVVHTHFTSDRSEVGTLLWNGQDRLQSALQASGLDMGQFRVDLERQGAGRSFQQGPPHEQGRGGQEQSGRSQGEPGAPDSSDGRRGAPRGMLNLVA
jgi:hypothetical protein